MSRGNEGRYDTADQRRPQPRGGPRAGDRRGTEGLQGDALVLELRRIQRAFDQEQGGPSRARHGGPRPYHGSDLGERRGDHGAALGKRRKGVMQRAVENCARRLGFDMAPPLDRNAEPARRGRPPTVSRAPQDWQWLDQGVPPRERPRGERDLAPRGRPRGDHDVAPRQRPPQQGNVPVPNTGASIELLRQLAHEAERQFGAPPQQQREPGRQLVPLPAEPSSAVGRASLTLASGAQAGWRYLFGTDLIVADEGDRLATRVGRSFEQELRSGLRVLILGLGVAGGWATLVPLSGAVAVEGNLVVESSTKKVQHPTGGVVAAIPVHDGMHVQAGDLVLRLDETQARAALQLVSGQLDEITVRIARLVAERDGLDEPKLPPALAGRAGDQELASRFASEMSLFRARATSLQNQKALLQSRIAQLQEQIGGFEAQIKSNASQVELISHELEGVQSLYEKHLAPITRLNSLQRDAARLEGERGQLQSNIAETKSKIDEAQLQMIRVDRDFRSDVIKDLREAEGKQAELTARRVEAQDQLNRIDIVAPTSGIITQLAVHTIGGVIKNGDTVMEIVPDADQLIVEAHLPPKDIDQVKVGQTTLVRFSAFDQKTSPQLNGVLSYVSADLTREQGNASPFYTVRVTLSEEEHRRLGGLRLVSGMPAEIFVQTGSRTMATYLLKPITDQLKRAFNER